MKVSRSESGGSGARIWAAIGLALVVLVALVLRLLHTVDLTDEAYYAATAYRFALGGRPILDEWSPHQLAALLVSPIVRVHLAIVGDTTGLMLTLRVAWLAMMTAAGAVTYAALRRVTAPFLAVAAVAVGVVFCPFTLMAPSYTTIAIAGLMVGVAGGIGVRTRERAPGWVVASGFGFALATVAYPTMLPVLLLAGSWLCVRHRERLLPWCVGVGAVLLPVAVVLAPNLAGLAGMAAYVSRLSGYAGGPAKLLAVIHGAAAFLVLQPAFWFSAACVGWTRWKRQCLPAWVPLTAATLAMVVVGTVPLGLSQHAAAMVLIASMFWILGRRDSGAAGHEGQSVLRWTAGIGVTAAVLFAYTSSNAFGAFGAGAVAVLPALLALASARFSTTRRRQWAALALIAVVAIAGLLFEWSVSYRDVAPLRQTVRVATGPYAGLLTTPATADMVVQLQADLRAVVRSGDRLLSYDRLPAAYLMTGAMPVAPMLWTAPLEERSTLTFREFRQFIDLPGHRPTVAVRNDQPAELVDYRHGLIDEFVRARMMLVIRRPRYRVMRVP